MHGPGGHSGYGMGYGSYGDVDFGGPPPRQGYWDGIVNETVAELHGQRSVQGIGAQGLGAMRGGVVNETMAELRGQRSVHGINSMNAVPCHDFGGALGGGQHDFGGAHGAPHDSGRTFGPAGDAMVRGPSPMPSAMPWGGAPNHWDQPGGAPQPPPPPPGANDRGAGGGGMLLPSAGSFVATPFDEGGRPRYGAGWQGPIPAMGGNPHPGNCNPGPPLPPPVPPFMAMGGDFRGNFRGGAPGWGFPTPQIGALPCAPLFNEPGPSATGPFFNEPGPSATGPSTTGFTTARPLSPRGVRALSPPRSPPRTNRVIDSSSFLAAQSEIDTERTDVGSPVASYLREKLEEDRASRRPPRESRWLPCIATC